MEAWQLSRQDQGVGKTVETLGDYLREQRLAAKLSLRQLAEQTGVSNPYLSQIERGLRRPSAEVLQQLAKALRISAETLYVRAGILNLDDSEVRSVELADPRRQRADRAAEAVAARRLPVVPGSEHPTRAPPAQEETDMAKTISTSQQGQPDPSVLRRRRRRRHRRRRRPHRPLRRADPPRQGRA